MRKIGLEMKTQIGMKVGKGWERERNEGNHVISC